MDAALLWTNHGGDIALANGDLVQDRSLRTSVLISLFTDARAPDDLLPPEHTGDPRGWWPDTDTEQAGSLLWLLEREKTLPEVAARAREYCETALAWLVTLDIAQSVTVDALLVRPYGLQLTIRLTRGTAKAYAYLWNVLHKAETIDVSGASIKLQFV